MDKFTCLKVFTRVAALGSFTAAAKELNTTQSAVSKKIQWLEQDVGITLFHRHARAVSLTTSGEQYLGLALKLIEEMSVFESQLRQQQAEVFGTLTLSVPSAFSVRLLAEPLNAFMRLHPDLSVDLSVSDKLADLVESDIDIAIRASYLKDSGLKAKWIMDNELVYFASPAYLTSHPPIATAQDLQWHKCLCYSLSTPSNLWRFMDNQVVIKAKVKEQFRCDSPEMLVQMAKLGLGIAAMPKWMIEDELHQGVLTQVLTQYESFKLPMYMVFKDSDYQPKRIRAFIDFLAEHFRSQKN
ncbi:transcriptional regulator, LysR family protein [Vibrio ichthyoenteri ATCC 700023]|uniref:Transcriptional regulator, LysR family protein n=1 Tax=Vibrio ichthyoenteri ATCC 700023 TaxID=870968 RepID=F9S5Z4_9VIBR|nr:LysR family transcriptional regulator [Vibrio ichthyoenteri]EGU34459.1 transcriptional regulator, LysR family protein [Vibrio ichthyoenteri ATCC 700023]